MDYRKLDAALVGALTDETDPEADSLVIFVRTTQPPDADQAAALARRGVHALPPGQHIFTATLSPRAVEELSEQPWVRSMKLSQKLRLLHRA